MIQNYPELFPTDINQGYKLHGMMPASQKMPDVQLRRIQLTARNPADEWAKLRIAGQDEEGADVLTIILGKVYTFFTNLAENQAY
jgi:hypothetical protein